MRFQRPVALIGSVVATLLVANGINVGLSKDEFSTNYPAVVCPPTPNNLTTAISLPSSKTEFRLTGTKSLSLIPSQTLRYMQAKAPAIIESQGATPVVWQIRKDVWAGATICSSLQNEQWFVGGAADVQAGVVRLLRPDAFEEDATRLVRAARYVVRLGATADPTLVHAAKAACHGGFVTLTGPTRMMDALRLIFDEPEPATVLSLSVEWGVLAAIEPGLAVDHAQVQAAWTLLEDEARDADRVALGLGLIAGGLDPARRGGWLTEGGLDRSTIKSALAAANGATLAAAIEGKSDADVDAACARVPAEGVIAAGGNEAARYLSRLRHIALGVDGDDVRRVAAVEGPEIGRLLIELRRACIDGTVADTRDAQLAWLTDR